MYTFKNYVPASHIWPNANDYIDFGPKEGLVRGYNIEVRTKDGEVDWLPCSYTHGDPQEYFNDEFHVWMYYEHHWKPTGRICFRGYGCKKYDPKEHDTFVISVEVVK